MLYSKEFYEIMEMFEKNAKQFLNTGHQGLKKEDKDEWHRKHYYCDDKANEAFIWFLMGASFGKTLIE